MKNKCAMIMFLLILGVFIEYVPVKADEVPINNSVITQTGADFSKATISYTPVDGAELYRVAVYDETAKLWKNFEENVGYSLKEYSQTMTGIVSLSQTYGPKNRVRVETYNKSKDNDTTKGMFYNNELYTLTSVSKEYVVTARPLGGVTLYETDATTESATLSWAAAFGAEGYYIYKGEYTEGSTPIAETTDTTYVVKGLSADDFPNKPRSEYIRQQYSVVPFSKGAGGYVALGQYSSSNSTLMIAIAPLPVTGLEMDSWSNINNKMTVKWDFYKSYVGGSGECRFEMEIIDVDGNVIQSTNTLSVLSNTSTFNLNINTPVIFRIRPYRVYTPEWANGYRLDDKKYSFYGEWRECVCVPNAKITKAKALSKGRVSLKWNKVKGAQSYTIYAIVISPSNKWTKKKIAKVGKNTTTYKVKKYIKKKKAKKYKEYFFIQANDVIINGKKYSSPYDPNNNYITNSMKLVKMKW